MREWLLPICIPELPPLPLVAFSFASVDSALIEWAPDLVLARNARRYVVSPMTTSPDGYSTAWLASCTTEEAGRAAYRLLRGEA